MLPSTYRWVISHIFKSKNSNNIVLQTESEAALMGAAFRAAYALYCQDLEQDNTALCYRDYILSLTPNQLELVCEPHKDSETIYTPMLQRYRNMAKALARGKPVTCVCSD